MIPRTVAVIVMAASIFAVQTASSQDDRDSRFRAAEEARIAVIASARAATVCIFPADGNGGGSGVLVTEDGFALTNYHVVQPCGAFMKCGLMNGEVYDAVVVGIDPVGDVALIKLVGESPFPVARLGDSDTVRAGDECFASGNPFLLATDFQPSVSWGIVSGTHRYQYPSQTLMEYTDCIQTDAAINPGNSGGPLFNAAGEVIGINGRCSFEKRGRVNVGVGYAISINQIKRFWEHLRCGRIVDHATLGATVGVNAADEIRVTNILVDSDAFHRGLRYDDQLIEFAGHRLTSANQFKNLLGTFPKGWRTTLVYRRDDLESTISVRLPGVHAEEELLDQIELMGRVVPPATPPAESDSVDTNDEDAAEVSDLYEMRRGFANYHFNRLEQRRVWQRYSERGPAKRNGQRIQVSGLYDNDVPFQLILGHKQSGFRSGNTYDVIDPERPLAEQLAPAGSGGLLTALHLWHRLNVAGLDEYGDVMAFGAMPATGTSTEFFDVLVATADTTETYFFFSRATGALVRMEMAANASDDPCVVTFHRFQEFPGILFPEEIRCEPSGRSPIVMKVQQVEVASEK